jgi:hypothetical protein
LLLVLPSLSLSPSFLRVEDARTWPRLFSLTISLFLRETGRDRDRGRKRGRERGRKRERGRGRER